jgi:hypothetical protein
LNLQDSSSQISLKASYIAVKNNISMVDNKNTNV